MILQEKIGKSKDILIDEKFNYEKKRQTNIIHLSLNIIKQMFSINLTTYLQFFMFKIILNININIIKIVFFLYFNKLFNNFI